MAIRPLSRAQQIENTAFLKALRLSGNARGAARAAGTPYGTMQYRRARHPAFATRWDAALASAQARLNATGTRRPEARAPGPDGAHRTAGGEPVIIRLKSGRMQIRAAQPGKLTQACEQAFLLALSATANVRLSAAAAGASEAAFYRRQRRNPGFAREMRMALQRGYERLKLALMAGFLPEAHADDAWQHNEPPELPQMSPAQALQLLYLHRKEAILAGGRRPRRLRRGSIEDTIQQATLNAEYMETMKRRAEDTVTQSLERALRPYRQPKRETPIVLPDLNQVTGWSKADPNAKSHGDAALFGGWRVEQLTPEQRAAALAKAHRRR